jgi:hypothetical protein
MGLVAATRGTLHHFFTIGDSLATSRCFVVNVGHDEMVEQLRP